MKRLTILAAVAILLAGLWLVGCGDDAEAAACAGCGVDVDAADAKVVGEETYCTACAEKKAAADGVAKHDCAGGCGMNDWPEDQMTEVDGKWYCQGCAGKLNAEEDGHGAHDGHNHG